MNFKLTILLVFFLSCFEVVAQQKVFSKEAMFQFNDFTFSSSWEYVNKRLDLEKITNEPEDKFGEYFASNFAEEKSYIIRNPNYLRFANSNFESAVLSIQGSRTSKFSVTSLYFFKEEKDSANSQFFFTYLSNHLTKKYGKPRVIRSENLPMMIIADSAMAAIDSTETYETDSTTTISDVNTSVPFITSSWIGEEDTSIEIFWMKELNIIYVQVKQNMLSGLKPNFISLYRDSEYWENHPKTFIDFDHFNGYKQLKFGMAKPSVQSLVSLKSANIHRENEVINRDYKQWFDISFDECLATFNKKNLLFVITLNKLGLSTTEYSSLLKDAEELFGKPDDVSKESDAEFTTWKGKKIVVLFMFTESGTLFANIYSPTLDDRSTSDKLY